MTNANDNSLAPDLDDLLAGDVSDLPDSDFDAWPDGTYHAYCSANTKQVAEQWVVEFDFKLIEARELANPDEDTAPAIGSSNSSLSFIEKKAGRAMLKKLLIPFAEHFEVTRQRELIDTIKDVEVLVTNKRRWDKKNEVLRFNPVAIAII